MYCKSVYIKSARCDAEECGDAQCRSNKEKNADAWGSFEQLAQVREFCRKAIKCVSKMTIHDKNIPATATLRKASENGIRLGA